MSKDKIVVISDIHIGTNAPTVWYQKKIHEPYLGTVLDWVKKIAFSVRELILLGDIVDFWTYPPDEEPPSFDAIMAANPNIFGSDGKLSQVLTALEGNVTYVRGNHDMNITQSDLDKIQNSQGYKIILCPDEIYYPLGQENKEIACTHGHIYTMFNAPDNNPSNPLAPLPIGQFVTRAVAFMRKNQLQAGQTVADLPDSGDPNGISLSSFVDSITDSLVETLLNYIAAISEVRETQPIKLANGQQTSIKQAKEIYRNLWSQWEQKYGFSIASKSAIADAKGTYMGWFAQKLGFEVGAKLVVMGHTHTPKSGLGASLIKYANSGFNCPSRPDIGHKHPTFVYIDVDDCHADVLQVVSDGSDGSSYQIQSCPATRDSVTLGLDFSCYVIIDNRWSECELVREDYNAEDGHYVVAPPKRVSPGKKAYFWLQDLAGINGTNGWVKYSYNYPWGITQRAWLIYACNTGFYSANICSGVNFYTKSDNSDWGSLNQIHKSGHPFFVRFIMYP